MTRDDRSAVDDVKAIISDSILNGVIPAVDFDRIIYNR
jgi:hypothetical protein